MSETPEDMPAEEELSDEAAKLAAERVAAGEEGTVKADQESGE